MTAVTVGSLCTGIAGLEHGLTLAGLNTETVFVSDIDKGACTWLEANVSAPNLGDFTALDELPPVDILTVGFPCQPLSLAGQRKGVNDERWLFDDICRLVGRMGSRPVLFLENVPGLLSANNGDAMARVVHGLAAIGYSITWGTMAAADLGAPHRRLRWWGLAYPADTDDNNRIGRQEPAGRTVAQHAADAAADADGARHERKRVTVAIEPTDAGAGSDQHAVADATGTERRGPEQQDLPSPNGPTAEPGERACSLTERFGPYAGAIGRWECVLGRTAPDPSVDGRLNPSFCEWMMGYPEGWVTDTLPSRNHSLKALGNAVVPQCAAAAFTALAARIDDQAADGRSQTPAARSLTRW